MSYHPEELITPEWMNDDFFQNILIDSIGETTVKINDSHVVPACTLGNHFASIIYRVTVTFSSTVDETSDRRSFIVKTMPKVDCLLKKCLSEIDVFQTEISMYKNVLPKMDELLKLTYHQNNLMSPKIMFHGTSLSDKILTLDDVSQYGYSGKDEPLNFDESKLVAKKLAKFHAFSYYMSESEKIQLSHFNHGGFNIKSVGALKIISNSIEVFNEEIKTWPELKQYSENLDEFEKNALDRIDKICSENQNGINVLNHGDFHFKNLLHKWNDQGDLIDTIFLDYQFSIWASPAFDLIFFLYAVASYDTREKHRDDLIYLYHKEFLSVLKQLKFTGNIPTLLDFQVEIFRNGFFEMFIMACMSIFVYCDYKKHGFDIMFQGTPESKVIKKKILNLPHLAEIFKKNIPIFVNKGFL